MPGKADGRFPDDPNSHRDNLEEISWEGFSEKYEESKPALIYDEQSGFNKLIGRYTAEKREHGEHSGRHQRAHG